MEKNGNSLFIVGEIIRGGMTIVGEMIIGEMMMTGEIITVDIFNKGMRMLTISTKAKPIIKIMTKTKGMVIERILLQV
jgi:hypothetical protein